MITRSVVQQGYTTSRGIYLQVLLSSQQGRIVKETENIKRFNEKNI